MMVPVRTIDAPDKEFLCRMNFKCSIAGAPAMI